MSLSEFTYGSLGSTADVDVSAGFASRHAGDGARQRQRTRIVERGALHRSARPTVGPERIARERARLLQRPRLVGLALVARCWPT